MELTREIRDRRVAVMGDVVKQLDRTDIPVCMAVGVYLEGELDDVPSEPLAGDLGRHVDSFQARCEVCMLGVSYLSLARIYDNISASEVFIGRSGYFSADEDNIRDHLRTIFDDLTIRMMETAFECSTDFMRDDDEDDVPGPLVDLAVRLVRFGQRHMSPGQRARAIAENIVMNDGEFILD